MKIGNAKQFVNLLRSLSSALIEIKIYRSDGIFRGKSHKMIQRETNAQLGRISRMIYITKRPWLDQCK